MRKDPSLGIYTTKKNLTILRNSIIQGIFLRLGNLVTKNSPYLSSTHCACCIQYN